MTKDLVMIFKDEYGRRNTIIEDKYFNYYRTKHFGKDCTVSDSQIPKKKLENTSNYCQQKKNCAHITTIVDNYSKLKLFKYSRANMIKTPNIYTLKKV